LIAAGTLPPTFAGTVATKIPAVLWVGSIEYSAHDLLLATEYSRWVVDLQSQFPIILPESHSVSERGYVMGSYRVTPRFSPGLYYSLLFPDVRQRHGRAAYQHDVAATLRYDLTTNWLVKVEGHFLHGTAALNSTLNGGTPPAALVPNWGLFLVKTTAYF
jgi:hypothetical protein